MLTPFCCRKRHKLAAAMLVMLTGLGLSRPGFAQEKAWDVNTPPQLADALKSRRKRDELAARLRQWYGADDLKRGGRAKEQGLTVAFAIEAPNAPDKGDKSPRVVSEDGSVTVKLKRVGKTDVYAGVETFKDGQGFRYAYQVGELKVGDWRDLEVYAARPEWTVDPNIPHGKIIKMEPFKSQVFDGTTRDWWVYIPAQAKVDVPCALMVHQDGGGAGTGGRDRVATVYDNLIAKGDIPPMVAIFINPGIFADGKQNRSVEYDTLSPRYAQFLIDEILPAVDKIQKLRTDAKGRGITGTSSGGICAFTVAWERPEQFSKVESGVGSFTNLQGGESGIGGGHNYPALIRNEIGWDRKGKPHPIRVFLSDGANDLDNKAGNWPLANQQMARALAFGGYDYQFHFGNGFHNGKYYMVLMPEAMRFLWRDEVKK